MKRRKFLGTVGAIAAPTALSTQLNNPSFSQQQDGQPEPAAADPRVFIFDDGRHAADLYSFEPPITPAEHASIVDQLAGSGADALVYMAGVEAGSVLYDSKVAALWGDTVKKWTHYVWYRAGRILNQLIADGHDPLKIICDRCHEVGILMIASSWVSLHGGNRKEHEGLGRWTAFTLDNPQFQVGEDPDPRAKGVNQHRFNFLHAEVRKERFQLFQELLSDYETDGIELNLTSAMPFCRFSEVQQLAPIMTDWLRDLRLVADRAQQTQGRRKRICARVPAHPDAWNLVGYEIEKWISEKLIDVFFYESSYSEDEGMVQDIDCTHLVKLTRGTSSRVHMTLHTSLGRQFAKYATPAMIWAGAANAYDQGADGIAIGDHHWTPNGWPWTAEQYNTLRQLGYPQLLATANKYYMVRSSARQDVSLEWLPGRTATLPKQLAESESVEVSFHVADDVSHWRKLGRIKSSVLRVRLANVVPDIDDIRVEMNGRELPDSILERVDMNYRLVGQGSAWNVLGPYGYAYDFHLDTDHELAHGRNDLKVTVLKKDHDLAADILLVEVDCQIEYRPHRNFELQPVEY